jgi:carboxymethylenebutenolidase
MPNLTMPSGRQQLDAYLAAPGGEGPWPGVVMIEDITGMNDDIRRLADHMAANGYLVVAPDLYSGGVRIGCIQATLRTFVLGNGPALAHIEAAREFVAGRPDCNGKVGIIGFCMGGQFALLAAAGGRFDAAAPNYGLYLNADRMLEGACPIVGSYAGKDPTIPPGMVRRLERRLDEFGVPHDIKLYPDATHSFFQNRDGVMGVLYRVAGLRHNPAACEDAWRRIFTFFGEHLAAELPAQRVST